jgi:hypothetical protein
MKSLKLLSVYGLYMKVGRHLLQLNMLTLGAGRRMWSGSSPVLLDDG